ncbi:hypothetical protein [Neobacillus terrae]|uniref:hypothetical protein n=1 Tax=Neobacillus terrae TaxID=3034837 RepID=UPI00140B4980|nr:hypothetical protein [Neobacillus terrae]NHM31679.1 hypothetical protein [Neobacillus terrae]
MGIRPPVVPCGTQTNSGGEGTTTTTHNLGSTPGVVNIDFDMFAIPDSLDVFYRGVLVASTNGPVSGAGTLTFNYNSTNNIFDITVVVTGPAGTQWTYTVNCPVPPSS